MKNVFGKFLVISFTKIYVKIKATLLYKYSFQTRLDFSNRSCHLRFFSLRFFLILSH